MRLEKAVQITHRSKVYLLQRFDFSVTPKEAKTFKAGGDPVNIAYDWNPNNGYTLGAGPGGVFRPDIRLLDIEGSVEGGFVLTHEARGKGLSRKDLNGNRALKTEVFTFINGGDSEWRCYSGGHLATSIIQNVTSRRGKNGENILTIKSATPDAFLGQLSLPQMSYILAGPAYKERFEEFYFVKHGYRFGTTPPDPLPNTTALKRASMQNEVGYVFTGADAQGRYNGDYVDPFSGLGNNDRDEYTMTPGQLMQPIAANDYHFLARLSSVHALNEMLSNHFKVNGTKLQNYFGIRVDTAASVEYDILTFDTSGTFNSIVAEAAKHGIWTYGWTSKSNFYFTPDFCSMDIKEIPVAATLVDGPSLIGDIEVSPATPSIRIKRAAVKQQPVVGFGSNSSNVLDSQFENARLGKTYPIDVPNDDRVGSEITMENYMGKNGQEQARRLWAKANQQTLANWNNHPYIDLGAGMLGKAVAFKLKDPKGSFDFTEGDTTFPYPDLTYKKYITYNPDTDSYFYRPGGKLFKCVRFKATLQDNGMGGGSFMCSNNFEEIVARPR